MKRPHSKNRRRPAATRHTGHKVAADFPEALFQEAQRAAAERELIEGYTANADYARRIAEEFAHVDSDLT